MGIEHSVGKVVLAQILPNILLRIQFGTIWGQQEDADIARHLQSTTLLMPASAVHRDHSVSIGRDAFADLDQCRFIALTLA